MPIGHISRFVKRLRSSRPRLSLSSLLRRREEIAWMALTHLRWNCLCRSRSGAHLLLAIRSLRRHLLNYPSEKDEQFDGLRPARGIVNGLLISLVFWTCLGAVLWRSEVIRWSGMAIRGAAGHSATEAYAQSSGHTGSSLVGAAWSPAFFSEWTRLSATRLCDVILVCSHRPYAVHFLREDF